MDGVCSWKPPFQNNDNLDKWKIPFNRSLFCCSYVLRCITEQNYDI